MKYIFTADWHLRSKAPLCFTGTDEEWNEYQFKTLQFIVDMTLQQKALLCIAGDLFDRSVPPVSLVNKTIKLLKVLYQKIKACAGNHETPYHNPSLLNQSAFGTLVESGLFAEDSFNIYTDNFNSTNYYKNESIVLCHELVFENEKKQPPHVKSIIADDLLKKYPGAEYIICGDNHHHFSYTKENQTVIVPGCTTIQSSDMLQYTPVIYMLDEDTKKIETMELPNNPSLFTNAHIKEQKERDGRIEAFVESLSKKGGVSLSFSENLKKVLYSKDVSKDVKNIIIEIEEEL